MDAERVEKIRERLLFCPICLDEYKDPRILPCHHSVCLECLYSLVHISPLPSRVFRCPECRSDTLVPHGGVSSFPPNFFISSLLDEIGCKPYNNSCDICQRPGLHAQFRCLKCDVDVCKFCIARHRLVGHDNENLPLFRLDTKHFTVESFTPDHVCSKHSEPVNLFCETCDSSVCLTCICHEHKTHETVSMAVKCDMAKSKMENVCETLERELAQLDKCASQITEFGESASKDYSETKLEIQKQRDILHAVVDRFTEKNLRKVDAEQEKLDKSIVTLKQDWSGYHQSVTNFRNFLIDFPFDDLNSDFMGEINGKVADFDEQKLKLKTTTQYTSLRLSKQMFVTRWGVFGFSTGKLKEQTHSWSCSTHASILKHSLPGHFHIRDQKHRFTTRLPSIPYSFKLFLAVSVMFLSLMAIINVAMIHRANISASSGDIDDDAVNVSGVTDHTQQNGALFGLIFVGYLWSLFCYTLYTRGV